jgi:hypothetical protein
LCQNEGFHQPDGLPSVYSFAGLYFGRFHVRFVGTGLSIIIIQLHIDESDIEQVFGRFIGRLMLRHMQR